MPNERGRTHEHKAPFHKQLSAQAFQSMWDAFRISTWSLSSGLCFQVHNSRIHCSSAGGYQIALQSFWFGGELPVFIIRHHTPNRDARTVTVQYDQFNCFLIPAESTLNTYCLINNASLYKGLLLFMYNHNENKKEKKLDVAFCHLSFLYRY